MTDSKNFGKIFKSYFSVSKTDKKRNFDFRKIAKLNSKFKNGIFKRVDVLKIENDS